MRKDKPICTGLESDENDGGGNGGDGDGDGGGCCGDAMVPMVGATAATTMMLVASGPGPHCSSKAVQRFFLLFLEPTAWILPLRAPHLLPSEELLP